MDLHERALNAERRSNIDLHRRLHESRAEGRRLRAAVIALCVAWAIVLGALLVAAML